MTVSRNQSAESSRSQRTRRERKHECTWLHKQLTRHRIPQQAQEADAKLN